MLTRYSVVNIVKNYKQFEYLENKQLEVSLIFTSNKTIKKINYKWRKINKPTNVLSMGMISKKDIDFGLILLGDVIISIETADIEAKESNISLEEHILRLFIHGILHIFEFDHKNDIEALTMEELEKSILQQFSSNLPALTSNYWSK